MKHALILAGLAATAAVGCPVLRASVDHPDTGKVAVELDTIPSDIEGAREAVPSQDPGDYAPLCSLAEGRYCHGCEDPVGCSHEDSGPLCCVKDTCVVWSGSHCSGTLGWCFHYTTEQTETGVTQATCHDESE